MAVKQIVTNIAAQDVESAKGFYAASWACASSWISVGF